MIPVASMLVIGSFVLGAVTLQEFAIALLVGIVVGTYSSLFVAAAVVARMKEREPAYVEIAERIRLRSGATAGGGTRTGRGRTTRCSARRPRPSGRPQPGSPEQLPELRRHRRRAPSPRVPARRRNGDGLPSRGGLARGRAAADHADLGEAQSEAVARAARERSEHERETACLAARRSHVCGGLVGGHRHPGPALEARGPGGLRRPRSPRCWSAIASATATGRPI